MRPHPLLDDWYDSEEQRVRRVRSWFDASAPHYDRITQAMSLGSGHWYRRHVLQRAGLGAGASVLDVACGTGRHLAAARAAGLPALGVDRDPTGLDAFADDPGVEILVADLEDGGPWPLGTRRFAGVIVTNYLFRPILPAIVAAVAPDGLLLYETFARGQERHGRPARREFHLLPNELLAPSLAGGLVVIAYEQGEIPGRFCSGGTAKIVQRIAAVGPDHPLAWTDPLPLG